MPISVFDLYSIGIGPSSSHTVGPMRAAHEFLQELNDQLVNVKSLTASLHGSLAFTGVGHGTNKAILMGLAGELPDTIDPLTIPERMQDIVKNNRINLLGKHPIDFNPSLDLIFDVAKMLKHHSNGMIFTAKNAQQEIISQQTYYSIGGGFIATNEQMENPQPEDAGVTLPFPFNTAADLLAHCERENMRIADVMLENEKAWRSEKDVREGLLNIAQAMDDCVTRGCNTPGVLPGGLDVRRRAADLVEKLLKRGEPNKQHPQPMLWLNAFALAANEENAAGGRVVTAPTNGAAGVIPAILRYYRLFIDGSNDDGIIDLLLTAGAIGILYKKNASISGAEMGCQGEVGVACSMAAGGLAEALGGTLMQVENAAEIAMEHSLGLTCDPVAGLVQIPCIERNALGAVKSVNSVNLALIESGDHKVSLDMVINTMREIGKNMNSIYKETSKGGLAVNVPEC